MFRWGYVITEKSPLLFKKKILKNSSTKKRHFFYLLLDWNEFSLYTLWTIIFPTSQSKRASSNTWTNQTSCYKSQHQVEICGKRQQALFLKAISALNPKSCRKIPKVRRKPKRNVKNIRFCKVRTSRWRAVILSWKLMSPVHSWKWRELARFGSPRTWLRRSRLVQFCWLGIIAQVADPDCWSCRWVPWKTCICSSACVASGFRADACETIAAHLVLRWWKSVEASEGIFIPCGQTQSWYGDLTYQNPTTALWLLPWCNDWYKLEKDKPLCWALSSCSRACFQICQLKHGQRIVRAFTAAYSLVLLSCTFFKQRMSEREFYCSTSMPKLPWKTCTAYFVAYFVVFTWVISTRYSSERSTRQTKQCGFSFACRFLGIREEEIAKPQNNLPIFFRLFNICIWNYSTSLAKA